MCGFFVTNKKLNPQEIDVIYSRLQTRGPDDVKMRIGDLGSYVFSRLACTGRQYSSMQPLIQTDYFLWSIQIATKPVSTSPEAVL